MPKRLILEPVETLELDGLNFGGQHVGHHLGCLALDVVMADVLLAFLASSF